MFKSYSRLWWAIIILIILCPLGLISQGTAFGEWGTDELMERIGHVPAGLEKLSATWQHSILPDYALPGSNGLLGSIVGYVLSAVVGVLLVIAVIWLLGMLTGSRKGAER